MSYTTYMGRDEKWKIIRKEFSEVGVQANNSNRLDFRAKFLQESYRSIPNLSRHSIFIITTISALNKEG